MPDFTVPELYYYHEWKREYLTKSQDRKKEIRSMHDGFDGLLSQVGSLIKLFNSYISKKDAILVSST